MLEAGQLEAGLAFGLARIIQPEPRRQRVVGANEATARVLEVDRVGHARQQAVEQIAFVKQRVFRDFQTSHVEQRQHHAVDLALGAVGQNAREERTFVAVT